MNADRRRLQAAAVALGLIGLLVLVAVGARAGHPFGSARLHQRDVPARVGNDLLTLLLIVWGLGLVVFAAAVITLRHEEWIPVKSKWLQSFVVTLVVISFLSFVGYEFVHHRRFGLHGQAATGTGTNAGSAGTLPNLPVARKPARFDWEFAVALAGIAVLTGAYFATRARRAESEDEPGQGEDELERVMARLVRETIDDLRAEADPRRAVIAAYARMEGILRRHGYGRRPAETPYEYLERVLLALRVAPGSVGELTDLFEYAKFSPHHVGDEMRDRALAAFVSLREGLKATA